jgi:hypothetical protein
VKEIHFRLLKKYLDEMIVNHGIIKVENPEKIVEKVKIDFLVKLAFRFYRKLYTGEVRNVYMNKWEWFRCSNCNDHCEKFKCKFDPDGNEEIDDGTCCKGKNKEATIQCVNCGDFFTSRKPENDEYYMPLCDNCYDSIGEEIDIWQRLFS